MLVVSAFTALMVMFEFIDIHSHTALGLWLTLIGALVAAYGAYEMGGRLSMPQHLRRRRRCRARARARHRLRYTALTALVRP